MKKATKLDIFLAVTWVAQIESTAAKPILGKDKCDPIDTIMPITMHESSPYR